MSGNYTPGIGRLAADEYSFNEHTDGYGFRHNANDIDLNPPRVVDSIECTTVGSALYALIGESAANFTAAGDLSGNASSQTVIGIQTIPVSSTAPSTNDVLVYTSGKWTPSPIAPSPPSGTASGDLGGTYPNPSVVAINSASVPTIGAVGNTLYVSGGSSLSYGALNLAGGANYVTGTLPTGNQASQTMGGDVSGTTASATVIKLQGYALSNTAPTTGYALVWSGTAWTPTALSFNTLSGDVTGSAGSNTVVSLTGSGGVVTTNANIIPGTDDSYNLGSLSYGWSSLYMDENITWISTFIPSSAGDLGMDLAHSSGRPHAFIDGYDHGLSAWRAYFGDGSDGDGTCNGSASVVGMSLVSDVYTLQRDCYFTNLTISSSADVLLDGYRLFVNGVLSIASGCSVGVSGNNATTSAAGAATIIGTVLGGSAGGTGIAGTGGPGVSVIDALGGSGGHGGAGGGSDGAAGIATPPPINFGSIRHAPEALLGAIYSGSVGSWTPISGGCGGGAGAGTSSDTTGGGGGGGGGVAIIAARVIIGVGSISVVGGAGGAAMSIGSDPGNGGGGGGGGVAIIVYGD